MITISNAYTQRASKWVDWKNLQASKKLIYQCKIEDDIYWVWGYEDSECYITQIWRNEVPFGVIQGGYTQEQNDSDKIDFETNFLSGANQNLTPDTDAFSNTNSFQASCAGFYGVATAGQTTNIDYTISETRYLVGVALILKEQNIDDTLNFQIVHPMYGVLSEFASNWNVSENKQDQGQFQFPLRGKLPVGLKIRVAYKSVGSTDVKVKVNLFLHKKV